MQADLIYDVGMGNGDDTAYYLSRGFRVVAIEANPSMVEQTSRRFEREIADGTLSILNIGICDKEGDLPFWICDSNSDWSSFARLIASRCGAPNHEIHIKSRRLGSVLTEFGIPYYLKLDIEGREICCLRDLTAFTDLPKYVSFEQSGSAREGLPLLNKLGYKGFKLISQLNYLPIEYPPAPEENSHARAGKLLQSQNPFLRAARKIGMSRWLEYRIDRTRCRNGWTFPMGSSGPFAEDIPGRWQSVEEIVTTLANAYADCQAGTASVFWDNRSYSFWADFHARRED
jgi:FkbM family methyltransferase